MIVALGWLGSLSIGCDSLKDMSAALPSRSRIVAHFACTHKGKFSCVAGRRHVSGFDVFSCKIPNLRDIY